MKKNRTRYKIRLNKPKEFVDFIINDYLTKNGFKNTSYNGEKFWQCKRIGTPKCFNYTYEDGIYEVEAWIRSSYFLIIETELDLNGMKERNLKIEFKNELDELVELLEQDIDPNINYGNMSDYNMQQVLNDNHVQVKGWNNDGDAYIGFILSILGIILSLILLIMNPIVYLISAGLGVGGIMNSFRGRTSNEKGLANAGIILGILAIIITIVMLIIAIQLCII